MLCRKRDVTQTLCLHTNNCNICIKFELSSPCVTHIKRSNNIPHIDTMLVHHVGGLHTSVVLQQLVKDPPENRNTDMSIISFME